MIHRIPNKNIMYDTSIVGIDAVIDSGACWFTDHRHNSLLRCQKCQIKFDSYKLRKSESGKFLCKYCLLEGKS
jgi:hypothetical protein